MYYSSVSGIWLHSLASNNMLNQIAAAAVKYMLVVSQILKNCLLVLSHNTVGKLLKRVNRKRNNNEQTNEKSLVCVEQQCVTGWWVITRNIFKSAMVAGSKLTADLFLRMTATLAHLSQMQEHREDSSTFVERNRGCVVVTDHRICGLF